MSGIMLSLAAACADTQPTTPTDSADLVVRGHGAPAGCVPEVIESSDDSTETVLVTFTVDDPDGCYPNLVDWGIDMADPVEVDTPQGSTMFQTRTGPSYINMPSPPYAAIGAHYTPPQVMIEFDPPVRSVEFHYSRLQQDRAMWGGQIVEADSMRVRAMSRWPGTLFYDIHDTEVLYSNVPRTTPPWDTWTYVKLTASSDKIQWLWFDGTIVIDDLRIVRMPVSCPSSVQRGQEVVCKVASPRLTVTAWSFTPDDSLPEVVESTSATEWRGIAAAGGMVTVHVTDGMASRGYTRRFNVVNRPSPWVSLQSYREGPEITAPDVEPADGATLGRNCPEEVALCETHTQRVQPDPFMRRAGGYTGARIPTGPNKGYWYVVAASYNMKRVGNLSPGWLSASQRVHLLPATTPKKCRNRLGYGPGDSVFANFYQYNAKCQDIDMEDFVSAAFGHEGFGYGGGLGHESLARAAAAEGQNDPHGAVEHLVEADSADLESVLHSVVVPISVNITERADDNPATGPSPTVPSGNRGSGPIWFWNAGTGAFTEFVINGF